MTSSDWIKKMLGDALAATEPAQSAADVEADQKIAALHRRLDELEKDHRR